MEMNAGNGTSELIFILDRSGSMGGYEEATLNGYNEMLQKQQALPGTARLTTVLFSDDMQVLYERIPLADVQPLTENEYVTGGCTALLDAMGSTILRIHQGQQDTPTEGRAKHIIVVIITDGYENASVEYSFKQIHDLITRQKEQYGWEFIFMGANMDAVKEARNFGIQADRAVTYHQDLEGITMSYRDVGKCMFAMRCDRPVDSSWKANIEEYVKEKQGRNVQKHDKSKT